MHWYRTWNVVSSKDAGHTKHRKATIGNLLGALDCFLILRHAFREADWVPKSWSDEGVDFSRDTALHYVWLCEFAVELKEANCCNDLRLAAVRKGFPCCRWIRWQITELGAMLINISWEMNASRLLRAIQRSIS